LLEAGLAANVEHGFVRAVHGRPSHAAPLAGVRFRRLEGLAAWQDKLDLASSLELLPDGKAASAADWTELERRKCEAGYMVMWLIERDGMVCGSFALAPCESLLRMKNLVISPAERRSGLARAATDFATQRAQESKFDWLGTYGLEGSAGSALYAHCGFERLGDQVEWVRSLPLHAQRGAATSAGMAL
jgi:GNAT superfamily N-acetyltransferase